MNSNRKGQVVAVVFFLAMLLVLMNVSAAPGSEQFNVTFTAESDLLWACVNVSIQELKNENTDFPFKTILNDTNINSSLAEVSLYEWKPMTVSVSVCNDCTVEFPNCTSVENETVCQPYNASLYSSCQYCGWRTEEQKIEDWLPRNLVDHTEDGSELRNQFEEVHIGKLETKLFRICYSYSEVPVR